MDKKIIFMTLLYIVLLVMMFIYIGMLIFQGDKEDKSVSYSFFGFAILISILCVMSVIKCESKSELVKFAMGISTVLMFALLVASIILSKPNSDKTLQLTTYANMALIFVINLYASVMLIGKPVIQPVFETAVQ